MYRTIILGFLFMINVACTNTEDSQEYLVRLETDKNTYSADTSTTIYLNVLNMGKSPVYFLCKGVIILEEYENDILNNYWTVHGFEFCGGSSPIQPNSEHLFDLTFLHWKKLPEAKLNEEVLYKLHFSLFIDKDLENPLNDNDQISDYFKIIRE